jgi:hypothetical protein
MGSNEGKEDRVIKDVKTGLFVSKMVGSGFVIIIEEELSSSDHYSFGRTSYRETADFIRRNLKSLDSGKCPNVPYPNHALNIS